MMCPAQLALWREACIALIQAAGRAILAVYGSDFSVQEKPDASPVTAADLAAHALIAEGLAALTPALPLLSEEGAGIDWDIRRHWQCYWLVDPLDGTREFVKRNGEFCINIALIEQGQPRLGLIHAPVDGCLVHAQHGQGAWLRTASGDIALTTQRPAPARPRVIASRSHPDARSQRLLQAIGAHARDGLGSALKFCRIAEGRADLYPRFGPTCEWDTAAGQCIVEAAGGRVVDLNGAPLRYNGGPSLVNPDFIALGDPELPWRDWLDCPDG